MYYEKLNLIFFFILFSSFLALSRYFLLLTNWHDKSADCPYCSEKMVRVLTCDGSLDRPPPTPLEAIVDVALWFIPECPQFLR